MSANASAAHTVPILIIGLGNPILGDDGVGWRVAETIQKTLQSQHLQYEHLPYEIDYLSVGGLSLMERLVGYDCAILIDAIQTGETNPGTVSKHHLEDLPNRALGHLTSSHDTTLQNALAVGKQMGAHLPKCIQIISIEAENVFDFSEDLSQPITEAVPIAVDQVIQLLDPAQWIG